MGPLARAVDKMSQTQIPSLWLSLARNRDSRISAQPEVAGDETENGQHRMDASRLDLPFSLDF